MARQLTDLQEAFLDALFGDANGDVGEAMKLAGYAKGTPQYGVLRALGDEILERSKVILAANSAKATLKGISILDDPTALGADKMLMAAKEIWDRSGLIKKDGLAQLGDKAIGILILPAKDDG
jgi:hypothetical protein